MPFMFSNGALKEIVISPLTLAAVSYSGRLEGVDEKNFVVSH